MTVFAEDRALLEAFRAGEKLALARVYSFYFDDIYRLSALGFSSGDGPRVGRIEREADRLDFVQDVFVRAFSDAARQSYDGIRPYRPFLLRLARNLRVDRARQQGREPAAALLATDALPLLDDLVDPSMPVPGEATGQADWQRLARQTASLVDGLGADLQELARLRFVEELSQADIADRLGTTRRRVRTLEGRLLRSVRQGLARLGMSPEKK